MLTSGARLGQGMIVVAWATSVRPAAISTRGWPIRSQDSYSAGPDTGSRRTGIGGAHAAGGGLRCHPETPITRTPSIRSSSSATRIAATAVPPGTRCQHCSSV